jgi:hypothetical protein
LVFVNLGKDSIMVNDFITFSNLPVTLVEDEKFKETSLDVNISQQLHEEKPSRRMVHT